MQIALVINCAMSIMIVVLMYDPPTSVLPLGEVKVL